jgi:lipid-A-disaccharide synthase
MADTPLFFLIAGEASGDLLGARLMRGLKEKLQGRVRFAGVGGPRMQAEGIELFFAQAELAHFGLFELLQHIPAILKRMKETVAEVKRVRPNALITIDAPDFCFRVAKQLKGEGIPLIHYVAPTVWVWRAGRAKKVAAFLDHLLALLPFEPPYFTKEGLDCTFVGHSIVESGAAQGDSARFHAIYKVPADATLITVLPGSRMSEVSRMMPVFREVVARLQAVVPSLRIVMPVVPSMAAMLREQSAGWAAPVIVVKNDGDKYDAFAASRAAIACSGTVSIELALAGLPSVTVYKVSPFTAALYRPFLKSDYANLVNIMHKRMVVPELLQQYCTPKKIVATVLQLLDNDTVREEQINGLREVGAWLGQGQFVPSERAASAVLDVVKLPFLKEAA